MIASPMIQDLLNPEALPDSTKKVVPVQTHISFVLVGDRFVYKIKKPVNFGFLDFLTLENRAFYCRQELTLNRRLARDIYIDVLPVFFNGKRYSMGDRKGKIVDYAVKMKRIPSSRLMISLYEKDALTDRHLRRLAAVLAEFHRNAEKSTRIEGFGKPEAFQVNTEENFDQVRKYRGVTIAKKQFNRLARWTERFYRDNRGLFFDRLEKGKIRDCHGDLHMEHVCFSRGLSIIDCIEFNDRFRYSDTVADTAFLLMDLEYRGGESLSRKLWSAYQDLSEEKDAEDLLRFYKVYRAFVRGKVISFQIDDPAISPGAKEEAVERARKYFDLAFAYIA